MSELLEGVALNRAIAERLGYKLYKGNGRYGRYVVMTPPKHEYTPDTWAKFWDSVEAYQTPEEAYTSRWLPDWANDDGAALRLCLDIALKNNWQVEVCPYSNGSFVASFSQAFNDRYVQHTVSNTSPAHALCLLALDALKV